MDALEITTVIDGVPYNLRAESFDFNTERRYRVFYNSNEYIFAYDSEASRFMAIGDEAADIPDTLESFISLQLENRE